MLDDRQIAVRRPLWIALSELWLDTELSRADLERIARIMADSGLSVDQLREVYLVEVAPVVYSNLLCVAGEWVGFDEDWLCSSIIRNLNDRPLRVRFLAWCFVTRGRMVYATDRHWKTLVTLVNALREKLD